jgi:DNA polymerase-4
MIFVVARPDAYVRLHHRILATIETCLPIAKVRSIDELVCHLLPSEAAEAPALAARIKASLADQFSDVLTCSIGIASTELLAKIAAELHKPDGCILLQDNDLPARLNQIGLKKIPGISSGIEGRLHAAGIRDFSGLWKLGPKRMRAIWGNVEGERFWNGLHGADCERPATVKRMFGHSRMLPADWRTPDKVHECARQLTLGASRRLRRAGLRATKLTLSLRAERYVSRSSTKSQAKRWNTELTFPPARDDQCFLRHLKDAMVEWTTLTPFRPRAVSVVIHGLAPLHELQGDLFAAPARLDGIRSANVDRSRSERLSETLDKLRSVHGPMAANLGPKVEVPGGYLGAKIAFGRIPELADFSECQTVDGETQFCSVW